MPSLIASAYDSYRGQEGHADGPQKRASPGTLSRDRAVVVCHDAGDAMAMITPGQFPGM